MHRPAKSKEILVSFAGIFLIIQSFLIAIFLQKNIRASIKLAPMPQTKYYSRFGATICGLIIFGLLINISVRATLFFSKIMRIFATPVQKKYTKLNFSQPFVVINLEFFIFFSYLCSRN
jgi:hypothetical protein